MRPKRDGRSPLFGGAVSVESLIRRYGARGGRRLRGLTTDIVRGHWGASGRKFSSGDQRDEGQGYGFQTRTRNGLVWSMPGGFNQVRFQLAH